jgi:ubiquinone/menaquinone biosynthesis C-methylase UbiE
METTTTSVHDESLHWESITTTTRFGHYVTEIEKRVVVKAHYLSTSPASVLDIGCEAGRWSKLLSDLGWKLICTDVKQSSLDICQQRVPAATCILANQNGSTLPCDTESMGLVLCIEVEQAIYADWFIDEAFRVLQKGGVVVGVFFNALSYKGLIYRIIPSFRARVRARNTYWYGYPLSWPVWRKRLCERGFTLIQEEGYGWLPFRVNNNSVLVPVAAQIERYLGLRKLVSLSPMVVFIAKKM